MRLMGEEMAGAMRKLVRWVGAAGLVLLGIAAQDDRAFSAPLAPASGAVNVRDFGAVGDGATDDTDALQRAINAAGPADGAPWWEARPVYLPAGVYRVTRTLEKRDASGAYTAGMVLIGESRDAVVLRLDDAAPGFTDPDTPRPVIMTSSGVLDTAPNKDHAGLGEGNDAYANFIEDLTIDVGAENPGAVAIDYLANNLGALRNLKLRAAPDSGASAISMRRKWPGPALLSRIEVDGFHIGVDVAQTEYGLTLDRITLRGQRRTGVLNRGNVVSAEGLSVSGVSGPAVINADARSLLALRDSRLDRAGEGPLTLNNGAMVMRNVEVGGQPTDGVWRGARRVADIAYRLPSRLPPESAEAAPGDWADVRAFGALGDGETDDTDAIQAAFDSGARAVLFPHGRYVLTRGLTLPPHVEIVEGMFSSLTVSTARDGAFARSRGMIDVAERPADSALLIRRLGFDMTDKGDQVGVSFSAAAPLTLQDIANMGVTLVDRAPQGGPVFLENVCCSYFRFKGPAGVWARQLNTEGDGVRIVNDGAPLNILGLKTEQHGLILETRGDGQSEVFGGLIYAVKRFEDDKAAFHVAEGRFVATYAEEVFDWRAAWPTHVSYETPDGLRRIKPSKLPRRGPLPGRMVGQIDLENGVGERILLVD